MAKQAEEITGTFIDKAIWDGAQKTAVSVRDGVLEYLGVELGMDPPEKTFTVFRSPATIANVANAMRDIPLTDEHVEVGVQVQSPIGSVVDAEMVDMIDDSTGSKLAIRNRVNVGDSFLDELAKGKRELSLGYNARLIPHSKFDFEQRDIEPHHLAVVDAGRCGPQCRFIDHSKKEAILPKLHKAFNDAEGAPNLEQIVEIAQSLPEALKKLPMDKLAEIMPMLQEIVALGGVTAEPEVPPMEEEPVVDQGEGGNPKEEEEEMNDAGGIGREPDKPFGDTAEFKDAVNAAVAGHTAAVVKAQDFVDEAYNFTGKTTSQVMRDALATVYGKEEFSDAELSTAFKMLKKPASDLSTFGDSDTGGKFSQLEDKEV